MPIQALKVTVATAGTPVRAVAVPTVVSQIIVAPKVGNTDRTYVGVSGMVKGTGVGVMAELAAPAALDATLTEKFTLGPDQVGALDLADVWVDADVSGESVLIAYVTP